MSLMQTGKFAIIFISILTTALFGVSDEIHQSFVPSRSADTLDVLADFTGSILGVLTFILMRNTKKQTCKCQKR